MRVAIATAKENSASSKSFSQLRSEIAIDVDVLRDHPCRRKPFRIAQTFLAPDRALSGIEQSKQIRCESSFVIGIVEKSGIARGFRYWTGITAHDRATARLRFDHRPTESFEARRI